MKMLSIFLVGSAAGLLVCQPAKALGVSEDDDVAVEEMAADADGSMRNAAYIEDKADEQQIHSEVARKKAEKEVKDSNWRKILAERQIGKAEQEIRELKAEQVRVQAARDRARADRVEAYKHLATLIKQIKSYRARIHQVQSQADRESTSLHNLQGIAVKGLKIHQTQLEQLKRANESRIEQLKKIRALRLRTASNAAASNAKSVR